MELNLNQKFHNIINEIDIAKKPNLFLHVCCAPCSCGVFYQLIKFFNIYIIFYNSNIDSYLEYNLRLYELKSFLHKMSYNYTIIYSDYDHFEFLDYVKDLEHEMEGGIRCTKCFELRLKKSFEIANNYIKKNNLVSYTNYMCTTLSVSPHKDAKLINEIGEKICNNGFIRYLSSDFKKEDGYINSIKLSKELGLYRQNYCGCEFGK